jgi:hypothetical protein
MLALTADFHPEFEEAQEERQSAAVARQVLASA